MEKLTEEENREGRKTEATDNLRFRYAAFFFSIQSLDSVLSLLKIDSDSNADGAAAGNEVRGLPREENDRRKIIKSNLYCTYDTCSRVLVSSN